MNRKTFQDEALSKDQHIKTLLESVPLPVYDSQQLAEAMQYEMQRKRRTIIHFPLNYSRMAWAASFVIGISLCISMYVILSSFNTIQSVQFVSFGDEFIPSWYWHWKLKNGYQVNMPKKCTSVITLADQSIIECREGTTLSVHFKERREIDIVSGWIEVQAKKNPSYPMKVNTPFGKVHVTGTVFQVEVIR